MNDPKILYLREEPDLDDTVSSAMEKIEGHKQLCIADFSLLCDAGFNPANYNIIIIRTKKNRDRIENIKSRTSYRVTSLIEIEESEECLFTFTCRNNCLHEKIPESMVRNTDSLSRLIIKNHKMLKLSNRENILLKELLNIIPDGVLLFDNRGRILESNSRITGVPLEQLKKMTIFDFLDEKTAKKARQLITAGNPENGIITLETNVINPDGKSVPVEVNSRLIRDEMGNPLYFLGILTDISARKRDWEKGQFLNHMFDTSPHGIIALNSKDLISIWNRGAEELFGIPARSAIGKPLDMAIPDKSITGEFFRLVEESRKEGRIKSQILEITKESGATVKLEADITVLRDNSGEYNGITATLRDITVQQTHMEEIRKKNEEMEHLINVVSHELRSPIHSVDNYISFILESIREKISDESVFEMFERIQVNLSNMEDLIRDLTDFSRAATDSGSQVAVDLNSVVDEIATNIQWQVGKDKMSIKARKLPILRINPNRIFQVFENLITNSFKFRCPGQPATVDISSVTEDDRILFTFRDYGIGISDIHRDKIFNLFYRTKEKEVDGTGAGLAITRKIINNYGGRIWVENPADLQGGIIFKFTLPQSLEVKK